MIPNQIGRTVFFEQGACLAIHDPIWNSPADVGAAGGVLLAA